MRKLILLLAAIAMLIAPVAGIAALSYTKDYHTSGTITATTDVVVTFPWVTNQVMIRNGGSVVMYIDFNATTASSATTCWKLGAGETMVWPISCKTVALDCASATCAYEVGALAE